MDYTEAEREAQIGLLFGEVELRRAREVMNALLGLKVAEFMVERTFGEIPYLAEQEVRESFRGEQITCSICMCEFTGEDH